MDLQAINQELASASPTEIVKWALGLGKKSILTTNFGPGEASIIHAVCEQDAKVPVVWIDSGYALKATYQFADKVIKRFDLNLDVYTPKVSAARRDAVMGGIPMVDEPEHAEFTEQFKLEPFNRAMAEHQPEVWFTNLRKHQTALRQTLDIVSMSSDGVIKVSPFFHYDDEALEKYLQENDLPNEENYYDPTKALANRECGLHTR
ncbi:phosphoadenosine phosphosulfate reductase family protein [uncultured Pseudoteredinibacter sp.]|uniref:phosphoadenosine phosphosulfate reductase domain-containing protein n=1 Tax=uncultured Pseudoteredinibacter sp. TaxID=1641701 RepID=UPI002634D5E3|nr:phosphoadenosine phosphosulfate reductase family protein [uncultured Pseudoteredinibacter sp.]